MIGRGLGEIRSGNASFDTQSCMRKGHDAGTGQRNGEVEIGFAPGGAGARQKRGGKGSARRGNILPETETEMLPNAIDIAAILAVLPVLPTHPPPSPFTFMRQNRRDYARAFPRLQFVRHPVMHGLPPLCVIKGHCDEERVE